jgi:hypothetical protein
MATTSPGDSREDVVHHVDTLAAIAHVDHDARL